MWGLLHWGNRMTIHHVKANFQSGTRREIYDGKEHLVVPVVMIVEGVLNGALVPASEFGKFPNAWNGRPVPVLHPEERGQPISANRPDVIDRNTIGTIFNTTVENGKLKAEAWINTEKARRLGFGDLLTMLEAGEVVEVSTGYFADDDPRAGEFNGTAYQMIHRNLRPDHLALLPGEIGACSVADGCGTRVNSKKESFAMKVNEAWATVSKALGLKANCQCTGETSMDILKEAEGLVKSNALDAKQLAAIQSMEPADRDVMAAFIAALGSVGGEEPPMEDMEDMPPEEEKAPMNMKAKPETPDIKAMVEKAVKDGMRRERVLDKLTANSANAFDEKQLAAMDTGALETYEKSIRPADYSGQGGFAANSDAIDTNVTPLLPRKLLGKKKEA